VIVLAASYLILALGAATMLIPLVWMVSTSLKSPGDVFKFPPVWIPDPPLWSNYARIFEILPFPLGLAILNSTKITLLRVVGAVASASIAAFAFARLRFRGSNVLFAIFLATMMIPWVVTLIPVYLMVTKQFGWMDTHYPLTVPWFFGNAYGMFLLRQFFMTIPRDLDDSAKIDGANPFWIYSRIYMPLAKPAVATFAVFTFMGGWNDLLGPAVYVNSPRKMTLSLGLSFMRGATYTAWELMMAGAMISLVPILILYASAQQYFVQGMVLSGLKG
jgi:multiple sugar transport system permease protein